MEEKKPILDMAVACHSMMEFLYDHGILAVWPWASDMGNVQMKKADFLATFEKYTVERYPSDDGGYGRMATAEYGGRLFFTLLEGDNG